MLSRERSAVTPGQGVPFERVVDSLGSAAVDVLVAPRQPGATVAGPRLFSLADRGALAPGELVLAVNVPDASLAEVVRLAGDAACTAVAVRPEQDVPDNALDAAREVGLGLLLLAQDVTWDQVFNVVHTLVTAWDSDAEQETPVRDLFSLANAVAAIVGGAVTIEDPQSRLLAYSNLDQPIDEARRQTILGRGHGNSWAVRLREENVFRRLISEPGTVIHVTDPLDQARPRLAASVGAGSELLGFIWVLQGESPFEPAQEQALKDSLPLAAMHLLRHRAGEDVTRRRRGTVLRELLDGSKDPAAAEEEIGLGRGDSCAIAAFGLLLGDEVELTAKRSRTVDIVSVAAEAFRRRVVCCWIGSTVYALFPSLDRVPPDRLVALAAKIASQVQSGLGVEVVVGVGSTVTDIADIRESRDEADRVVTYLRRQDARTAASGGTRPATPRTVHVDHVRVPTFMLALEGILRGRPELRLPALERLAELDRNGSEHLRTLALVARHGGNVAEAAKELSLHPNTVRYRVGKACELSGMDSNDPETVFVIAAYFLAHGLDGHARP